MCEQLTSLAQSSNYRQVHICEHGMVHLTWDYFTVYLPAPEFERLVDFVGRGLRSGHTWLVEGRYQMVLTNKGYYQLWISNAGLLLSAVDSLIFVDLIAGALRQLKSQDAKPPVRPFRKYEPGVMASPNSLFSLN